MPSDSSTAEAIAVASACGNRAAGSGEGLRGLCLPRSRAPLYGVIVAGGLSLFGNAVAGVVLPWIVLSLTGNAAWTGIAAAAGMMPLVIGAFFGGPVVDRFGSRVVAVTADLASASSVAAIPLLMMTGQLDIGLLIGLIVIGALLDGPGMIAHDARVPELARVARMPIERVTSIDELLENAALIFGPPVAGIAIAAFGMEYALLITAGCSLLAAFIGAICLPRQRRRTIDPDKGGAALAGLRFLLSEPLLRLLLVVAMVMLAVFGALNAVILPVLFKAGGADVLDLGLFLAVSGAGAALSAVTFAVWGHAWNGRAVLLAGISGATLAIGLIAFLQTGPYLFVAAVLIGLSTGALGPLANAVFLKRAPASIRGSVLGTTAAIAMMATPLAVLVAGFGVEAAGSAWFLWGLTATLFLLMPWVLFSRAARMMGRSPP
ncbi:MFS transporter [Agrobacterium sp. NPDC089420]|uniref:MFS transporter n=1 Tax=Agrobacterium sp. NPDC089420 TaxID=3363918 RepID=UPI00384B6EFB